MTRETTAKELLENKITALKQLSFSELCLLPEYTEETHGSGRNQINLLVWKDELMPDLVRVGVQVFWRPPLPGFMGRHQFDGFRMGHEGKLAKLTKDDVLEFC